MERQRRGEVSLMARGRPRRLKSFTERDTFVMGVVGTLVVALMLTVSLGWDSMPFIDHGEHYSAEFAEAGLLQSGDAVVVSGVEVGRVSGIHLSRGHVVVDFDITDTHTHLGSQTRARIVTLTLLGKTGIELDTAGTGSLAADSRIPLARTTAPYDVTEALADLTDMTTQIDVSSLAKALTTVSGTFQATPRQLNAALQGVSRISRTIASRDQALQQLLTSSKAVTGVLASRNAKITALLGLGSNLLASLNARQQQIVALLDDATRLADALSRLVRNNQSVLAPALDQLNRAVALLNRNKKNVQQTLDGLANYSVELGEAVATGPFFDAYVQNLTSPASLVPVLSGVLGK
jgi:phospholipid/cholesterol/gamma-HCH transport system substrate-binding protein